LNHAIENMKYRKAPHNKQTSTLFITFITPFELDVASTEEVISLLKEITTLDANNSVSSHHVVTLNDKKETFYSNQLVIFFNFIEEAVSIKDALSLPNYESWIKRRTNNNDLTDTKYALNVSFTTPIQEVSSPSIEDCDTEVNIPGLILIRDFISEEEEKELLNSIEQHVVFDDKIKSRRVKHYGFEFDYNTRKVNPLRPIEVMPEWASSIANRISSECNQSVPDQLTINEYSPGQGIKPHTDTHSPFEDGICSLSLRSDIVMNFTHPETEEKRHLLLPQRSLLVMTGESRYLWRHGIHCRKQDRINNKIVNRVKRLSLTFRKVRRPENIPSSTDVSQISNLFPPCQCNWPKYCDSKEEQYVALPYKTDMKPTVIESEYVIKFYNAVASHWDHTRHSPWPAVNRFIFDQPKHSLFADVGCGNGKYIKYILDHGCYYIASDRSEGLVEICSDKYGFDVSVADATDLPYRSNQFDAVINIAVMHHISNYARRLQLLKELIRITRPGGQILVTAWAYEQGEKERRKFPQQDTMVPWQYQTRYDQQTSIASPDQSSSSSSSDKENKEQSDEEVVFQRYCHVYKQGELEELLSHISGIQIISAELERGNWNICVLKLQA
jgi:alkylated DNA repair protein alkB family protein 8